MDQMMNQGENEVKCSENGLNSDCEGSEEHISKVELIGEEVTLEDSLKDKDYAHASHAMLWSKWENHFVLEQYIPYAAILMQMRFDGYVGFPGGMIDEEMYGSTLEEAEEKSISAVSRELVEEMNVNFQNRMITKEDYLFTYRHPVKKLYLHFYSFEVSMDSLKEIENMAFKAMEYGNETLGVLRVPLYTMTDGYRGFPAFLNNNFIPCCRQQLLQGLEKLKIMPKSKIEEAVKSSLRGRK